MILEFIKVEIDYGAGFGEREGLEDLQHIVSGTGYRTRRKPKTIRASEIVSFETSEFDENWTDVETITGEILIADLPYIEFKTRFHTALNFKPEGTWKIMQSGDPRNLEMVVYKN